MSTGISVRKDTTCPDAYSALYNMLWGFHNEDGFFNFIFIIFAIVFIYCGGFSWTAVTGHRCKALEDFPLAAAGSLAVSSGICVYALELPLGLSYI